MQVNLPPGIIEKAAEQLGVELDNQSIDTLENAISRTNEEQRIKQKQEELIRAQKYPAKKTEGEDQQVRNSNE